MLQHQVNAGGQVLEDALANVGDGVDPDLAAGSQAARPLQFVGELGPAIALDRKVFAAGEMLQPVDELVPVDQKCLSRLKSPQSVHQPDRHAPANSEHRFKNGTVNDRGRKASQLVERLWNPLHPFGFARHESSVPP